MPHSVIPQNIVLNAFKNHFGLTNKDDATKGQGDAEYFQFAWESHFISIKHNGCPNHLQVPQSHSIS